MVLCPGTQLLQSLESQSNDFVAVVEMPRDLQDGEKDQALATDGTSSSILTRQRGVKAGRITSGQRQNQFAHTLFQELQMVKQVELQKLDDSTYMAKSEARRDPPRPRPTHCFSYISVSFRNIFHRVGAAV